jgi:chromosome segregation ATPase
MNDYTELSTSIINENKFINLNESKLLYSHHDEWEIMDNPSNELFQSLITRINDLTDNVKKLNAQVNTIQEKLLKVDNAHEELLITLNTIQNELSAKANKIDELVDNKTTSRPFDWLNNKNRKLSEKDLLKIDYLRSRNTCIRTKSTTGFLPEFQPTI